MIDLLVIIFEVATAISPDSQQISGFFFFILVDAFFITASDLIHVEAAYIRSEKAFLIWGLIKVCISNIIIAHIVAAIILGMTYLNPSKTG